jgi:predicted ATP-binding protein involved in virulence
MIVTRLKIANVRAVEAAVFSFKPGFNLIVGVNGVGKTTALESLAVSLAAVSRHINKLKGPVHGFVASDIRAGREALTVEAEVNIGDKPFNYVVHQPREAAVAQAGKEGLPREQTVKTPAQATFVGDKPPLADGKKVLRPLAVFFSTRRAVPSDRAATKAAAKGGYSAAFAEAFSARELRLGEFAAWMRAQSVLAQETPGLAHVLDAFEQVVRRFLPGYANLRVSDEATPRLLIDRQGVEIPVRQLSDGERGSLALVLDLTRRLAQANPGLDDPAAKGPGVVLIDEIDLHLHPRWQREIVRNLSDAFPKVQFIATTHSPQVIGEVEHDRIQVMGRGPVFSPTHSFGVDSSRVLEEIMEALPRSPEVQTILDKLSKSVVEENLDEARALVASLANRVGESDAEVIRARTMLDFLGGEE